MDIPFDRCVRKRISIEGEHFYLIIGRTFLDVTVPRENAPDQSKVRAILEQICNAVSEVREGME